MEQIYTIPINEAFEAGAADKTCGCPICSIYRKLEENELDTVLGGAMMEPDVRIKTNELGFCKTHYDMLLGMKNRLAMALTLESHLDTLKKDLSPNALAALFAKPAARVDKLQGTCYICGKVDYHFERIMDTVVAMWKSDEEFSKKYAAQPYFCLPHYKLLLDAAKNGLSKRDYTDFEKQTSAIVKDYLEELSGDVSWFCRKFDYRYENEPWYNAKDSVERAVVFLRSDLHRSQKDKPRNMGGLG